MHPVEQIVPQLPGWSTNKKAMLLYSLVVTHKPSLTVDLGTFGGRTCFPMAYAHKELNHGFCVGIDPWRAEACLEGLNDEANADWWTNKVDLEVIYRGFMIQILAHGLTPYTNILRMKSEEAVTLFTNQEVFVLSLDGNHSELKSCQDVQLWAPRIQQGGYIVFDDSNWPTTQAAQRLLLDYGFVETERNEEVVEGGGVIEWTVFQKISNPTE